MHTRTFLIVLALVGLLCNCRSESPPDERALVLPQGVTQAEFVSATREFAATYHRSPDRVDVLSWLAEQLIQDRRWDAALACLDEIPDDHPRYGPSARLQQADVLLELRRPAEAEQQYLKVLDLENDTSPGGGLVGNAQMGLTYLLGIELRFEERQVILADMVNTGRADRFHTLLFCFPTVFRWNGALAIDRVEKWVEAHPADPVLRAAQARYRASQGELDLANDLAGALLEEFPEHPQVLSAALYVFQQSSHWERVEALLNALAEGPSLPRQSLWIVPLMQGHVALRAGHVQQAIEAYREAIHVVPTSPEAWAGLLRAATTAGDTALQEQASERVQAIARIQNRLGWTSLEPDNPEPLVEIAMICKDADMVEFARLIVQHALRLSPENGRAKQLLDSLPPAPRAL